MAGEQDETARWESYHRLVTAALHATDWPALRTLLTTAWHELAGAARVEWRLPWRFDCPDDATADLGGARMVRLGDPASALGELMIQSGPDSPLREGWVERLAALTGVLLAREAGRLSEKLEAMAEFAAGAGHEVNNPLATIAGRVQMLLRGEADPDRRQSLATIAGQAFRIRDMIGDAMLFARPPRPTPEPLDLAAALDDLCGRFREDADARGVALERRSPGAPVQAWADPTQFNVAVGALIRNGLEAVEDGGRIIVAASAVETCGRSWAAITVEDDGPGLSDEDRQHLFDPFYSGRPAGRGLGFGLSKCWRIVTNHGGRVDVDSRPGRTVLRTLWPTADPRGADF